MASQVKLTHQPDFSLIVAKDDGRVLTVGSDATLAVFSGEGEAKTFLLLDGCRYGWKVRRTSPEELISMLDDPCTGAQRVALDPSPEMVAERLLGLVSVDKDHFLQRFAKRGGLRLVVAPHGPRKARALR